MKFAIIVTCYNRCALTVRSLLAVKQHLEAAGIDFDVHLTDDGCTDGTAATVRSHFPAARIYQGGDLFWAGGMRLAWRGAIQEGGYDYYFFLNDDTFVDERFVPNFLECHARGGGRAIISGAISLPGTERPSYVGFRITSKCPYRTFRQAPTGTPCEIDFAGANVMLIPHAVVERIGVFPEIYVHGIADYDYCLRAQRAGFKILMTGQYIGECVHDHTLPTTKQLRQMTRRERWNYLCSPKGKSIKQWIYFQWSFFPWRVPSVVGKFLMQWLVGVKD